MLEPLPSTLILEGSSFILTRWGLLKAMVQLNG
jgi:hypothetical protein